MKLPSDHKEAYLLGSFESRLLSMNVVCDLTVNFRVVRSRRGFIVCWKGKVSSQETPHVL